jgi:hypothetical protein
MMAAPERARLVAERYSERQRLANLTRRLDDLDTERHGSALAVLQEAMRTSADRLTDIEAALAGPTEPEISASRLRVHAIRRTRQPDHA